MVNYVITGKVRNDFLEGDEDIIIGGEFAVCFLINL